MTQTSVRTRAQICAFAAAALLAGSAAAVTKDEYRATTDRISAEYKAAKAKCNALSGQPKDLCVAEANAAQKRAKARAAADYENTAKARENAVIADAEATYMVAKEQCTTKTGNDKDVCVKAAKAAETKRLMRRPRARPPLPKLTPRTPNAKQITKSHVKNAIH